MTDLVPTREHTELASAVRALLDRRSDSQAVRRAIEQPAGFDTDLWATLCGQIGVAALAIPEERGGAGFTLAETHVVLEELGRALTPSPLLASFITSAALVRSLSLSKGQPTDLLPRIAEGAVATVAWSGITGTPDARVGVTWKDGVLRGSASPVLYGDVAEILLVAAAHDGVGLFSVDPTASGLSRTRVSGMDPTLGFAELDFDGVHAEPIALDATSLLTTTHRVGTLATAALQVGCAQRGLDMTVEYAKQREQFGRPLGSFQALKHRMADMLVRVQMSRAGAWAAIQAHVNGAPDADRLAAAAASYSAESAMAVAAETIQLHGGIAITWEHDAHLVFKRAQALHQLFGLPHQQRATLIS
ncbi:acyl-CoA dehydrogenase family protein [Aeromicrobium sp.]|uniref:acyl-CoA dehydrogenase family protein n=1 Tax=Aeromicrobium sp. TaxID=1871063 RepID=UPI003D6B8616